MSTNLFNGALGAAFTPSQPFLIPVDRVILDFLATVGGAVSSSIEYYLEFTPDPVTDPWAREVSEDDIGGGVVDMPAVVRTVSGLSAPPAAQPQGRAMQLIRIHQFCRVQLRVATGTISNVQLRAIFVGG